MRFTVWSLLRSAPSRIGYHALLAGLMLVLLGCGGGGDGGGKVVQTPPTQTPESAPPQNLTTSDIQALDPAHVLDVAQGAADSTPKFGSVVQSVSEGIADTNTADVEFDRGQMALTVTRADGSRLVLDSRTDTFESRDGFYHGYNHRAWALLKASGRSATIAATGAEWSPNDYGDWITGGVWLHFTGNLWTTPINITGVEIGAFVDGPELDGLPTVPSLGTATYNGSASGWYVGSYGSDAVVPLGTVELGGYDGDLRLAADFGAGRISGRIHSIKVTGIAETPGGQYFEFADADSAVEIHLGATGFTDGQFTGGVTVTSTVPGIVVANSSGSWGGKFSTIPDGNGNPRLVAGTLAGEAATAGGSVSVFVGAFNGATGQRGLTPHE